MSNTETIIQHLDDYEDYWENLPAVQYFKVEDMEIIQKDTRAAILGVLRIGMERSGQNPRHILNADEIYHLINTKFGRDDTKSTIYYHLGNLVNYGFIQKVGVMETNTGPGRKYTSYYGRSAKMFLIKYKDELRNPDLDILLEDSFLDFLIEINPNRSQNEIKAILDIITYETEDPDDFIQWQNQFNHEIEKHELNLFGLYDLIEKLYFVNHRLFDAVKSLRELMHYKS